MSISIPVGTASGLTTNISSFLNDPGLLTLLLLVAGIPLGFYVAHKLLGLIPGKADPDIERAKKEIERSEKIISGIYHQ